MNYPRLYSLSTVCLLKHYNQDYLMHPLRTDFTGSNGVGKSIIADLFQIIFIADSKHIKFATEGINKKKRKIETLPYQSGIGYSFFNVEVSEGKFIIVGAAILGQGATSIKPFIITASVDYNNSNLEQNAFDSNKLLFNKHFIKSNKEPYTLDALAHAMQDKFQLYVHYFSTKDEREAFYAWLYKNELISINLVKESNLKAFAKVIQSFSKSKSLDIDNSNSLIEYLFEENENEIEQEYKQQEQAVQKLLFQFKSTKENIINIGNKQKNLLILQGYDKQRKDTEFQLLFNEYIVYYYNQIEKQTSFKKHERDIKNKSERLKTILARNTKFSEIVNKSAKKSEDTANAYGELVKGKNKFDNLDAITNEIDIIDKINVKGLICTSDSSQGSDLLKSPAQVFSERISKSSPVLKRYKSIKEMDDKKKEQDEWLKQRTKECEEKENQLKHFKGTLDQLPENSFFIKALSSKASLVESQQIVLLYLRRLFFGKPNESNEGTRYTESGDLLNLNNITEDEVNGGWWLKLGEVHEFIPKKSSLLPDLSEIQISNLNQLKVTIGKKIKECADSRIIYEELLKGNISENFNEYPFDIDLSDYTKIKEHKSASELSGLLAQKMALLKSEYQKRLEEINTIKKEYGISSDDLDFISLLEQTNSKKDLFNARSLNLKGKFNLEKIEGDGINETLPQLEENQRKLALEVHESKNQFEKSEFSLKEKYPNTELPDINSPQVSSIDIAILNKAFQDAATQYIIEYNQIVGRYEETREERSIQTNEQITNKTFSFEILEEALLGRKIKTLDKVTDHLEELNSDLLKIADELLTSLTKVFGKTEHFFDRYKSLIQSLNDFFKGRLISDRFYFKIDFTPNHKLDIKWIEQLRRSVNSITTSMSIESELTPERFIGDFYAQYSKNKAKISIEELLNPKKYFLLAGKLTDENGKEIPGSTGESYTAIALLGIARLSIVQDGNRKGLRFLILEESATLDNTNFGIFPLIAKEYGYQIITMTPKPYALGGDEGWYIHHLLPGKINRDINYPNVMSYFRTITDKTELDTYLKAKEQ